MMKCKYCGAPLKEGARFCPSCGKPAAGGDPAAKKRQAAKQPAPPRQPAPSRQQVPPRQQVPEEPEREQKPKKKGKGPLVALLILLLIALMGAAGFVGYRVVTGITSSDDSSDDEDDKEKEPEEETEEAKEEETQEEDTTAEAEATEEVIWEEQTTEAAAEAAATAVAETSAAETQQNETAIHRYVLAVEDCTWTEAYDKAKGAGGYLVHINSQEEYDYLVNEILDDDEIRGLKLWIGGARADGNYEYHWANTDGTFGEEVLNGAGYEGFWMENEPSFRDDSIGQDEYYMNIFYYNDRWVWNDVPNDLVSAVSSYQGTIGYIIEIE